MSTGVPQGMAMTDQMTITLTPKQAEGLCDYIDLQWTDLCEALQRDRAETAREHHTLIGQMVDLAERCVEIKKRGTRGTATATRNVLEPLVRGAAGYGKEAVGWGRNGTVEDAEGSIRLGRALQALARREGLSEEVAV